MELKDFKTGQRVWTNDEDERKKVFGTVTEVKEDQQCVWIEWDDLFEPVKHETSELSDIHPAK